MGLFDKLRQTVANVTSGGGAPDLDSLPPDQRAVIEARYAEAQAGYEAGRAATEAARGARIFSGAAAAFLYGEAWYPPSPMELERIRSEQGMAAMIAATRDPRGPGFREALRETAGLRTGPAEIEDPHQRAHVAAAELAAREAARAPYRASGVPPVAITRIATRGDTQIEELLEFLRRSGLAGRPDLVWGVSRVPDRISPMVTPASERGRVVEWEVVHVPGQLPPAPTDAVDAFFPSRQRWFARQIGEPALLDEDVGRAYAWYAGVDPADCLGIARMLHLRSPGHDERPGIETWVEGVHVIHRPTARTVGTLDRMTAAAPMALDLAQLPPARVEVLEWYEVSRIVQPQAQHPPRVPNPVPSLPSTPEELLRAYLEVVGVLPTDCWSAQVTVDDVREMAATTAFVSHTGGPPLPCADGKDRRRLHGAQQVVVAYRDRPEYVDGRARWAAYQRDVLEARLDDASDRRAPVERFEVHSPVLRAALAPVRALEWLDQLGVPTPPPPYRYCWPPLDA